VGFGVTDVGKAVGFSTGWAGGIPGSGVLCFSCSFSIFRVPGALPGRLPVLPGIEEIDIPNHVIVPRFVFASGEIIVCLKRIDNRELQSRHGFLKYQNLLNANAANRRMTRILKAFREIRPFCVIRVATTHQNRKVVKLS